MSINIIGLDIGTTGCKALLCDQKLNIIAEEYYEYELIYLSQNKIEQDANVWWELSKKALNSVVKKAKVSKETVKAISISSQGIAFLPVDEKINPIRNAISWLDKRAVLQKERILKKYEEKDIFLNTGKTRIDGYTLLNIMWLMENERDIYEKTYKFLLPHDFIAAKLTKKTFTDHTLASGTLMYNIETKNWWEEILLDFSVDKEKLPKILNSGEKIGKVRNELLSELNVSSDCVVVTGGQDQKCAAYAAGINNKSITVSLGTASAIEKICTLEKGLTQEKIPIFSYLFQKEFIMEGVIPTTGLSLKWFKNLFMKETSYKDIDDIIATETEIAKVFFYPYLTNQGSPKWDKKIKGFFYGFDLTTKMSQVAKAVLEGTAFEIKQNIDAMISSSEKIDKLIIFGGGAKSDEWCQIISDVTNLNVITLKTSNTAALGACRLALKGIGLLDEEITLQQEKQFKPFRPRASKYKEKYLEYLRIENKMIRK